MYLLNKAEACTDYPLRDDEGNAYTVDDIVARHWGATGTGHQRQLVVELGALVRERENEKLAEGFDAGKRKATIVAGVTDVEYDRVLEEKRTLYLENIELHGKLEARSETPEVPARLPLTFAHARLRSTVEYFSKAEDAKDYAEDARDAMVDAIKSIEEYLGSPTGGDG